MQLQTQSTTTSATRLAAYFEEKCTEFTKNTQNTKLLFKIETLDDLLAAKILNLPVAALESTTKNNLELPKATDYSINSQSKTLTAYLCNPSAQNLNYALTHINQNSQTKDPLAEYILNKTSPIAKNELKIPLLNELSLLKAITNNTNPLLLNITSNEKNTAILLEEININPMKKYNELTLEEKKTLTGQLVKYALENNTTSQATRTLTGLVYNFENEIAQNSLDMQTKAQAAVLLNKPNAFLKAKPNDLNSIKQLNAITISYLNMQKATIKHALRMTSDYGKFNYYDCKTLPAWLGAKIAESLQTLEQYAAKPLVITTSSNNSQIVTTYVQQIPVKQVTTLDLNATLKEINNEFN